MTRPLPWFLAASLPLVAGTALAESKAEPGYSYEFEIDFVDGDQLTGHGSRIRVLPPGKKVLLIRPRTSFVPELYETIEDF